MRLPALLLLLALAGCGGADAPVPATPHATTGTATTVGGATLQTAAVAIADLNQAVAARYGIDRSRDGVLLLVMVRDAVGNGIEPGDLQLAATAAVLPDPPRPLDLRAIRTDGMTDYLGVVPATAPATIAFRISATRDGSSAEAVTTSELRPR